MLTHGDTTTTVFGALIGKVTRTKVMHVESGLRSFKLFDPFPEEINRIITFRLSDYYACPGEWAVSNVAKFSGVKINTIDNTQLDVLSYGLKNMHKATIELPIEPHVVLSSHRFENLYNKTRFQKIIEFAELVSERFVVHHAHASGHEGAGRGAGLHGSARGQPTDRAPSASLEYENYLKAIVGSEFVMTDGGGNQEELFHLGKPTLILRDSTERQEGIGRQRSCRSSIGTSSKTSSTRTRTMSGIARLATARRQR